MLYRTETTDKESSLCRVRSVIVNQIFTSVFILLHKTFQTLFLKTNISEEVTIIICPKMKKIICSNKCYKKKYQGATGFEPGTSRSAVECSTTELHPRDGSDKLR